MGRALVRARPAPVQTSAKPRGAAALPRKRGPKVDVELTRQRRSDIIRAAARLFDEVGYHGVNMETIAEAAGLKKPTLYHYMRSKDEILFQIHESLIEMLRSRLDDRRKSGADAETILLGVYQDIFEQMYEYPGYVRAFFEHMRELDGERLAKVRAERNGYLGDVIAVIEAGMRKGHLRRADPRLTALALLGVCNWGYQWYRAKRDGKPKEIAAKCWEIFRNGLAA